MMSTAINNPIIILDDVSLDLPADVIAEMTMGMEQVDGLVLETNPSAAATPAAAASATPAAAASATPAAATPAAATPAAAATYNDDDWFRAGPSSRRPGATPERLSSGKNMKALLKSFREPSPPTTSSPASSQSSSYAEEEATNELLKFLQEEQRRRSAEEERRAEWARRFALQREVAEKNLLKARSLVASLAGERKVVRNQREALRAQLRALDDQDLLIDKRERSAVKSVKLHERIAAKYKEMNI